MTATKQQTIELNYDVAQGIAEKCPFTPTNFVLVKLLPAIKVKQQRNEPDPDNEANEGLTPGEEGYVFKQTEVEVDSMYQTGVVIKLDMQTLVSIEENKPVYFEVGQVVVFPARAHYSLEGQGLSVDGYTLVRPFDILGSLDLTKVE